MKLQMHKIGGGVIAAAILVAAPYNLAYACSRVLWNTSDKGAFVSRSVDWYELIDPEMIINPRGMNVSGGLDKYAAKWTSKFGVRRESGLKSSSRASCSASGTLAEKFSQEITASIAAKG